METKGTGLANISFPVFKVGTNKPYFDNGASFYVQSRKLEDADKPEYRIQYIDDKHREEPSFALRRLAMQNAGIPLFKLSKAIFFLGDLIKIAKKGTWFVDKDGNIFEYEKTRRAKLVYKDITSVTLLPAGGAVVEVKGIPGRFKTLFIPTIEQKYAGILVVGMGHILYGLYTEKHQDTYRLV